MIQMSERNWEIVKFYFNQENYKMCISVLEEMIINVKQKMEAINKPIKQEKEIKSELRKIVKKFNKDEADMSDGDDNIDNTEDYVYLLQYFVRDVRKLVEVE